MIAIQFTLARRVAIACFASIATIALYFYRMTRGIAAGALIGLPSGATGTISAPPDAIISLSGPWEGGLTRQERSALGMHTVYWMWFEEPQCDADDHGPYRCGQIWESALEKLLHAADCALYQAKNAGRNRVEPSMGRSVRAKQNPKGTPASDFWL